MVTDSELPVMGGVPRLTDNLGEGAGYPRPSGLLAMLRLGRFRHHLLVPVVSNPPLFPRFPLLGK